MKICKSCGTQKNKEEFSKNRVMPDGLQFYCKECDRLRANKRYGEKKGAKSNLSGKTTPETYEKLKKVIQQLGPEAIRKLLKRNRKVKYEVRSF